MTPACTACSSPGVSDAVLLPLSLLPSVRCDPACPATTYNSHTEVVRARLFLVLS